jgi:hypothetical protein
LLYGSILHIVQTRQREVKWFVLGHVWVRGWASQRNFFILRPLFHLDTANSLPPSWNWWEKHRGSVNWAIITSPKRNVGHWPRALTHNKGCCLLLVDVYMFLLSTDSFAGLVYVRHSAVYWGCGVDHDSHCPCLQGASSLLRSYTLWKERNK